MDSMSWLLFVMYSCQLLNDSVKDEVKLKHVRPLPATPLQSWFGPWPFVPAPIWMCSWAEWSATETVMSMLPG